MRPYYRYLNATPYAAAPNDHTLDKALESERGNFKTRTMTPGKETILRAICWAMSKVDEDLFSFLHSYGFSLEELDSAFYEIQSFRSIPGTTLRRYMNRIIGSIKKEDRPALLKGIILGVAIRGGGGEHRREASDAGGRADRYGDQEAGAGSVAGYDAGRAWP